MIKNSIKSGFTLIELLVVIAIIGLLSSVVLASLNSARTKAKNAEATMEFNQIEKAAQMDYSDYGVYALDTSPGFSPRFVGTYLPKFDGSYYCSTCVYDYQNWGVSQGVTYPCVMVDLYQTTIGPILKRHMIDKTGCPSYIDF